MAVVTCSKVRQLLETSPVRHLQDCSRVLMSCLNHPVRGIRSLQAAWMGRVVSLNPAAPCWAKIPDSPAGMSLGARNPESQATLNPDNLAASVPPQTLLLDQCWNFQLLHSESAEPAIADQPD